MWFRLESESGRVIEECGRAERGRDRGRAATHGATRIPDLPAAITDLEEQVRRATGIDSNLEFGIQKRSNEVNERTTGQPELETNVVERLPPLNSKINSKIPISIREKNPAVYFTDGKEKTASSGNGLPAEIPNRNSGMDEIINKFNSKSIQSH